MEEKKAFLPHVLMLPWLALGHVIPQIELAKRLADRGLRVHLCSTPSILSSVKQKLKQEGYSAIETIDVRLPPTPGLPSHHESTSSLPPHLMLHLKKAFHSCKPALTDVLTTLNPDFIVHDTYPSWIPALASELRIRSIQFITFNAMAVSFSYSFFTKGTSTPSDSPLRAIKLQDYESRYLDRILRKEKAEIDAVGASPRSVETSESILIFKTVRSLEGKFLDYVQELTGKEAMPVGILAPQHHQGQYFSHLPSEESAFVRWLESRKRASVVFVSFGTEYFMSREEIAEIALGLEMSEQSFIWVIRLAREGGEEEEDAVSKMDRELPSGFLDRVKDKGMVVNGWAPQTTILSHPSTGGFLTHCGWGSLCEGMACGVPFVALPLSLDQPVNARLVVGELGLGVEVQRGSNGEFRRGKVAEAIRRVMVGEEREELRRRAKEMAEKKKGRGRRRSAERHINKAMEEKKAFLPHVLMLPWLALGHVIAQIELAKRLTDRGLRVHLCSTPSILSSVKQKLQQEGYSAIETIDFQLPPTPGLPSHHESTSSLPPHLMLHLKKAFDSCKPALTDILTTLNPDFIVHDTFPPWIPALAAELHIRSIQFITFNATAVSFYYSFFAKGTSTPSDSPLRAIKLQDYESRYIDRFLRKEKADMDALGASPRSVETSESILIFKTARSLEGKFLDYVQELTGKEAMPVGILAPQHHQDQYFSHLPSEESAFVRWLEARKRASVVFVSFGSEYFMSREEIAEIALGLEMSEQSFIWVIRLAREEGEEEEAASKMERVVPAGFLERVKDKGMVVNGWAPQLAILSHPSTGGFLTHCGWGSLCEGMGCGVPFIALPLSLDQPINARLVVGDLGLGVEVERGSNGEFRREKVAEAVRKVMVGEEGEELRKRAKDMAKRIKGEDQGGHIDELLRVMERM
ncbi:Beta-D-glucosyl crocetin beta-1-6-glucosyltransferase [Nymphaea thermarum]|nr:Beta-D-glucosyl crocetin beta-1-6-glucosyltransferase [Nymphaea thermarum]